MNKFRVLGLALACVWPSVVFGTMCVEKAPAEIARSARIAFIGTAKIILDSAYKPSEFCWDASWKSPNCGGKLVTLEVTQALRGSVSGVVSVISQDACYCTGIYWAVNGKYLVVAAQNPTELPGTYIAVDGCEGTGRLEDQSAVVEALESIKE